MQGIEGKQKFHLAELEGPDGIAESRKGEGCKKVRICDVVEGIRVEETNPFWSPKES